jgi:kynureninase
MLAPAALRALDANDPLRDKRQEFILPEDTIYLDGNSLGPLSKRAQTRVASVVTQEWGDDLIASWNKHSWIDLPTRVGEKIAPLIGASPGQTVCCDSISINLYKLLGAALNLRADRSVVITQADNFPTDIYVADGLSRFLGDRKCRLKSVEAKDIIASLDETVAVLMLTQVNFRSGAVHDIEAITRRAHDAGVLVVWDLAHSAGALPLAMDDWAVDFAVGCGYKYLNGGPGAPAFVYVAERLQEDVSQPLSGWMGHAKPFAFSHDYMPGQGVQRFLTGTPNILSMASLDAALDIFADVSMPQIREKSIALGETFADCVNAKDALTELKLASPQDSQQRGSQLSYSHPQAFAIAQALIAHKVIVDFRAPDIVRFGFTPLYTSYTDVWQAVEKLAEVVRSKVYLQDKYQQRSKVT